LVRLVSDLRSSLSARVRTVILVSACLADMKTRYDGDSRTDDLIRNMVMAGEAVPVCPELLGGLPVPREEADIVKGSGWDVLGGNARVLTRGGIDVTSHFVRGAQHVIALAASLGVTKAVLKSHSPSCGSGVESEDGVTAALLKQHGIEVMTEEEFHTSQGAFRG
jgi:uncharacterized protein YbbK (DUF523 family)